MKKTSLGRTGGGAGGGIESVVAGSNIAVNNADPENPIVSTPDAVRSISTSGDATVDNTDPENPSVGVSVPVKSLAAGQNVTILDNGSGAFSISSFQPLNEPAVQRIANGITLPAQVANIIVSSATATPITILLPVASDYPQIATKIFETRIANFSAFDVTVKITDGSDFVDTANQIVLKANQKDTILLRAFNFPVDGALPALFGWSLATKLLVNFFAQYAGSVDMDDFNAPGEPIAFREGTGTDNDEVFELNDANETEIFIKTDCTATVDYSLEVDAKRFGPTWNIDTWAQINRSGTTIIPQRSRTRTGNFGGEDAFVSQSFSVPLQAGDVFQIWMQNNGCDGEHKAATVNLSARL